MSRDIGNEEACRPAGELVRSAGAPAAGVIAVAVPALARRRRAGRG